MKKFFMIIISLTLCLAFISPSAGEAKAPKFGDKKFVSVKMSKSQISKKIKTAELINDLTNNKIIDGGFLGVFGGLAKESLKKAGIYGALGGGILMGVNKLTAAEKKDLAKKLKLVNKKKAKGIVIKTEYRYYQSFDTGEISTKGYWVQYGRPKITTYK